MKQGQEVDCSCIKPFLNPEDQHFLRFRVPTADPRPPLRTQSNSLANTQNGKSSKKSLKKRTSSHHHAQDHDPQLKAQRTLYPGSQKPFKGTSPSNKVHIRGQVHPSVNIKSTSIIPHNDFSFSDEISPLTPPYRPTYLTARPQMSVQLNGHTFPQTFSSQKSSQIQIQQPHPTTKHQEVQTQERILLQKFEGFQQKRQEQQKKQHHEEGRRGLRERPRHKVFQKAQIGRMVESGVALSEEDAPSEVIGRGFESQFELAPKKPSIETAVSGWGVESGFQSNELLSWSQKGILLKLSMSRQVI